MAHAGGLINASTTDHRATNGIVLGKERGHSRALSLHCLSVSSVRIRASDSACEEPFATVYNGIGRFDGKATV